jgi:hypothetical protein
VNSVQDVSIASSVDRSSEITTARVLVEHRTIAKIAAVGAVKSRFRGIRVYISNVTSSVNRLYLLKILRYKKSFVNVVQFNRSEQE